MIRLVGLEAMRWRARLAKGFDAITAGDVVNYGRSQMDYARPLSDGK